MPQVPIRQTVLSPTEAERLLRLAWEARLDVPVQDRQLRLLLALWDLETARGQRMWNHNWGNIIETDTSRPFYTADDSGNLRRFKAYLTADEGADDFLGELHFKREWFEPIAKGASPEAFARGLKARGYFEAPLDRYARTLRQRWELYPHLSAPMRGPVIRPRQQRDTGSGPGAFFFSQRPPRGFIFGIGANAGDHLPKRRGAYPPRLEPLDIGAH